MSNTKTELLQIIAVNLHETHCGCGDYIGIGDEDSSYEDMANGLLLLIEEARSFKPKRGMRAVLQRLNGTCSSRHQTLTEERTNE